MIVLLQIPFSISTVLTILNLMKYNLYTQRQNADKQIFQVFRNVVPYIQFTEAQLTKNIQENFLL